MTLLKGSSGDSWRNYRYSHLVYRLIDIHQLFTLLFIYLLIYTYTENTYSYINTLPLTNIGLQVTSILKD